MASADHGDRPASRGQRIVARLELPPHRDAVAVARHVVRAFAPIGDHALLERSELVVSELVTNAIRHGSARSGSVVELTLILGGGRISGQVCDSGPPFGLPAAPPPEGRIGGYGLHIARQVASVEVDRRGNGNVVSFSVSPSLTT